MRLLFLRFTFMVFFSLCFRNTPVNNDSRFHQRGIWEPYELCVELPATCVQAYWLWKRADMMKGTNMCIQFRWCKQFGSDSQFELVLNTHHCLDIQPYEMIKHYYANLHISGFYISKLIVFSLTTSSWNYWTEYVASIVRKLPWPTGSESDNSHYRLSSLLRLR